MSAASTNTGKSAGQAKPATATARTSSSFSSTASPIFFRTPTSASAPMPISKPFAPVPRFAPLPLPSGPSSAAAVSTAAVSSVAAESKAHPTHHDTESAVASQPPLYPSLSSNSLVSSISSISSISSRAPSTFVPTKEKLQWLICQRVLKDESKFIVCESRYAAERKLEQILNELKTAAPGLSDETKTYAVRHKHDTKGNVIRDEWEYIVTERQVTTTPRLFRTAKKKTIETVTVLSEYGISGVKLPQSDGSTDSSVANSDPGAAGRSQFESDDGSECLMNHAYVEFVKTSFLNFDKLADGTNPNATNPNATSATASSAVASKFATELYFSAEPGVERPEGVERTETVEGSSSTSSGNSTNIGVTGRGGGNLMEGFRKVLYSRSSVQFLEQKCLLDLSTWLLDFINKAPMPTHKEMITTPQGVVAAKDFAVLEALVYFRFLSEFSPFSATEGDPQFFSYCNLATSLGPRINGWTAENWTKLRESQPERYYEYKLPISTIIKPQTLSDCEKFDLVAMADQVYDKYLTTRRTNKFHPFTMAPLLEKTNLNVLKIIYAEEPQEGKLAPRVLAYLAYSLIAGLKSKSEHDDFFIWTSEKLKVAPRPDILNLLGCFYLQPTPYKNHSVAKLYFRAAANRGEPLALQNLCNNDPGNKKWFAEFANSGLDSW